MADTIERKEYPKGKLFDLLTETDKIEDGDTLDELVEQNNTRDAFVYDALELLSNKDYGVEVLEDDPKAYDTSKFDKSDAEDAKKQFNYD